ncbi:MAG: MBL fold metallo-hydrolase [Fodinibius sp.]|nr:MBL fold metallo-hydrolase [Fodinibius sp.]
MSSLQSALLTDHCVHPICIATPFAVGDVFCYLIVDEKVVLVDAGPYTDEANGQLSREFQEHGLRISDLDEIWLTHGHPDHFGQVARIVEQSGARVYGHPQERTNFAGNDDGDLFEDFFRQHRIPSRMIREMVQQLDWLQQYQQPIEPEWIAEGDQLTSGALTATVKHTPGHAPGHVVFESDQGVIFGGDLLLGHISTNALINFDPDTDRRNQSLLQYRQSLQWMRQQEGMVLPGHGNIIEEVTEVADHHLSAHDKRYHKIRKCWPGSRGDS